MKKGIGYYRTSGETGKSNKGFGLETQKREIREYCKKHKIELIHEYIDDGVSGVELEKSLSLMELLSNLNGEEYILAKSSCRLFGRDEYRQVMVKRELRKAGKKVIFTDNPDYDLYTNNPTDILMNGMLDLLDQYEKMNITIKLLKGRRNKVRKTGQKGAGPTPLGYKWETSTTGEKVVVVDEETKPIVEYIYRQYGGRNSLSKVSDGVMKEYGVKLTPQRIQSVLTNEFYVGKVKYGDVIEEGSHFQFTTMTDFRRAKRRLKLNRKR
jgi:site-specific DNA recombinase